MPLPSAIAARPAAFTAEERIYRHEIGALQGDGLGHVGPEPCFGVWRTVGAAIRPQTVRIVEYPGGKSGFAAVMERGEATPAEGVARLICAARYSPSLAQLLARGVRGVGYLHATVRTRPGEVDDHLDRLDAWVPAAEVLGLSFVGAFRTLMCNDDQGLVVWAIPNWADWARYEDARLHDPLARRWAADCAARGVASVGRLLVGMAGNPLDGGPT